MTTTGRGRPRSEQTRTAVLSATRDLLEELGYEKLTMDAIAARSGASKMTIYRWWSSKAGVVAEAAMEGTIAVSAVPIPSSGNLEADLNDWIATAVGDGTNPQAVAIALALTAATAGDPAAGGEIFSRFTEPTRDALVARLRAGVADGQLSESADVEAAVDYLLGAMLYRLVTRAEPDPTEASRLSALLWSGLAGNRGSGL